MTLLQKKHQHIMTVRLVMILIPPLGILKERQLYTSITPEAQSLLYSVISTWILLQLGQQ